MLGRRQPFGTMLCSPLSCKSVPCVRTFSVDLTANALTAIATSTPMHFGFALSGGIHHKIWQGRCFAYRQGQVFRGRNRLQCWLESFVLPVTVHFVEQIIICPYTVRKPRLHSRREVVLGLLKAVMLPCEIIIHHKNGLRVDMVVQSLREFVSLPRKPRY